MSKSLQEVFEEISRAPEGSTRKVKSFSRSDWDKLLVAYLNTPDYKSTIVKVKGNEIIKEDIYPVKNFRKMLVGIAEYLGVDSQEASVLLDKYRFTESEIRGMYYFMADFQYLYLSGDKKIDFLPRENFRGGIVLQKVPGTIATFKAPRTGEVGKVKKEEHYVLKSKSKIPRELKRKLTGE